MKNRAFAIALLALAYSMPAEAEMKATAEWKCFKARSDFEAFQAIGNGVTVNNFTLAEMATPLEGGLSGPKATQITFKYSVANRSAKPAQISVQLVAFDASEQIVFSTSANPKGSGFSGVGANETGEGTSDLWATDGDLKKATSFCVRAVVKQ